MITETLKVGKRVWFISQDELTAGDLIEGHITKVNDDDTVTVLQWDGTGDTVASRYPLWTVPVTTEIATSRAEADDIAYAYLFNLYKELRKR